MSLSPTLHKSYRRRLLSSTYFLPAWNCNKSHTLPADILQRNLLYSFNLCFTYCRNNVAVLNRLLPAACHCPRRYHAVRRTTAKRFFIISKASFVFLTTLLYPVSLLQSMFLCHLTDFSRLPGYPDLSLCDFAFSAHKGNMEVRHF